MPDGQRQQPVGDARRSARASTGAPAASAARQLGRAVGLDADHPDRGLERGHGRRDPGDQAAAADRHQDGADLGPLLQDLEAAGALPGDDVGIVEGGTIASPSSAGDRLGPRLPLGRAVAGEDDLAAVPPAPPRP